MAINKLEKKLKAYSQAEKTLRAMGDVDRATRLMNMLSEQFAAAHKAAQLDMKVEFQRLSEVVNEANFYLSPDFMLELPLREISNTLQQLKSINIQHQLKEWFYAQKQQVFQRIKCVSTARLVIIQEIEHAFELKMFSSVVMLSYAQCDGIWIEEVCQDENGLYAFDHDKKTNEKRAKWKKNHPQNFSDKAYRSSISNQLELGGKNELMKYVNDLKKGIDYEESSSNRHLVFHGRVSGYGTELNAIRAILLLDTILSYQRLDEESPGDSI
ncbi:MAG: hypothetical protein ACK417_01140 [Bacteroidia bacterium]